MDSLADETGSAIDLGPTRGQLFNAFVWVALGLLIGSLFIVLGSSGGEVTGASLGLGIVLIGLALVSAALEFRALPGVLLNLDAQQLVVRPRRHDVVVLPVETLQGLQIDYVKPVKRGFGRRPGTSLGGRAPGWWLTVVPKLDATHLPGHQQAFPIGVDDQRIRLLAEACERSGLAMLAPLNATDEM